MPTRPSYSATYLVILELNICRGLIPTCRKLKQSIQSAIYNSYTRFILVKKDPRAWRVLRGGRPEAIVGFISTRRSPCSMLALRWWYCGGWTRVLFARNIEKLQKIANGGSCEGVVGSQILYCVQTSFNYRLHWATHFLFTGNLSITLCSLFHVIIWQLFFSFLRYLLLLVGPECYPPTMALPTAIS